MAKITIETDERYPDYQFAEAEQGEYDDWVYDVPDETVTRWKRVTEEYNDMLDEMSHVVTVKREAVAAAREEQIVKIEKTLRGLKGPEGQFRKTAESLYRSGVRADG